MSKAIATASYVSFDLSPADAALQLTKQTMGGVFTATSIVQKGRKYVEQVCVTLTAIIADMSPAARSLFKADGPVKLLRNACNKASADFTIKTSKAGPIEVIARSEQTKQTGKANKASKPSKASPDSEASESSESESGDNSASIIEELQRKLASSESRVASLIAENRDLRAKIDQLSTALATATNAAAKQEQRAISAEKALSAAAAKPVKTAAQPSSKPVIKPSKPVSKPVIKPSKPVSKPVIKPTAVQSAAA